MQETNNKTNEFELKMVDIYSPPRRDVVPDRALEDNRRRQQYNRRRQAEIKAKNLKVRQRRAFFVTCAVGFVLVANNISERSKVDMKPKVKTESFEDESVHLNNEVENSEHIQEIMKMIENKGSTQAKDLVDLPTEEKIEVLGKIAQDIYLETGLLPSVTLGQLFGESGFEMSDLAKQNNNMFGVKATNPTEQKCSIWTTREEDEQGNEYYIEDYFRKYDSIEEAFSHRATFLSSERYNGVLTETTPRGQITAIKEGGYATDTNYIEFIMSVIEDNNLTRFDNVSKTEVASINY